MGGDVAVECVHILNEKGIKTELHVVGASVPSKYSGLNFIHPHGFLTGGLANYVYEGVNGFRLPSSSTSVDFAAKIEECMREDKFAELNQGALRIYNEFLNWKS